MAMGLPEKLLTAVVSQEDSWFVAQALEAEVASQGESPSVALPQLGMWAIDEWAERHHSQLEQAWEDSRVGRTPAAKAPLE